MDTFDRKEGQIVCLIKIVCLSGNNLFPLFYVFIAWQISFTIMETLI